MDIASYLVFEFLIKYGTAIKWYDKTHSDREDNAYQNIENGQSCILYLYRYDAQ